MPTMEENSYSFANKGIFISKTAIIVTTLVVVALFVAEGLIIGLVGRPECDVYVPILETTKAPPLPEATTADPQATTASQETGPWTNIRLPDNLVPDDYEVSLRPILQPDSDGKYWFKGSSVVRYWCKEPTTYLIIHSKKLDFTQDDVSLQIEGGANVAIKSMMFYEPNQYLIVETDAPCLKDVYYKFTVSSFTGELADDLDGLYRSEYEKSTGESVVIATTQMQATGARKTFPCFDEPAFKANFTIEMFHRKDSEYFSISNMPVAGTEIVNIDGTEWNRTSFEETVPMSTYLLAMVVSDFSYAENKTRDNVQTRIYGRSEQVMAGEAAYAALITPHILDFFVDYFQVSYPLPKSDQIGVPDFGAGAMENWGLVIYREPYILYNENTTTIGTRLFITSVIAHELAHQWFGNLVSPAWWDELWLNEGFATYVSYLGEADVQPTWKTLERFVTDDLQRAFRADELTTSHPLVQSVNTPDEISAQFDTISYSKGASILRMINGFLGQENFVNGLTEYLNALAYGVATHDDLFDYWSKHTAGLSLPVDLRVILETWTLQMGFPVVNVVDVDPITSSFRVTQEYFLIDPDAEAVQTDGSQKYGYNWYIPFTYKKGSNLAGVTETIWLSPNDAVTLDDSDFILGNVKAEGYYRVNYDKDSWDRIANRLNSSQYTSFPEENRAQLLDDVFSLANARKLEITVPVEMASYLYRDDSYVAWSTFMSNIKYFDYMLGRTPAFGPFCKYILDLVVPSLYDKYGWEENDKSDEALIERLTRSIGIDAACYYGHQPCVDSATEMFSNWMESPNEWGLIPSTFRSDVLCTAIRHGGVEEWNFAWERFSVTTSPQWQTSLRYGLACSKEPWILYRYLEFTLDPTKIRKQDAVRTMEYVGREEYGRDVAWAFMVDNWDRMVETFGSGWSFGDLITSITRRFSTEYDLQLLEDFKNSTANLASAKSDLDRAIEKVKANVKWRAANEEPLTKWFEENA